MTVDTSRVCFRYRDHHDGKEKTMTLNTDHFISRVLWHVPVKGQHNVRYYGLYVPGARTRRDMVRKQLDVPAGETATETEKPERRCPQCGTPLLHYRSRWRKISYTKNVGLADGSGGAVQPDVRVDRAWPGRSPPRGLAENFLSGRRRLN